MIGDGAMSAGMAYEALNNAGALKSRLLVILNDNNMSIAPATGALNTYLNGLAKIGRRTNARSSITSACTTSARSMGTTWKL